MYSVNRVRECLRLPALVVLCLTVTLAASTVFAGPPEFAPGAAVAAARQAFPQVSLPARTYGEEAIARLGDKLPSVAAWYGMTTATFARMLREDPTAWIDKQGRLLFVDQFPEPAESEPTDPLQEAPFPLSETFNLNSRPSSRRVIYLDFNGHETSGTAWNVGTVDPIISPAYTRDSNPAFSDLELEYIQKMWRQVAEDFAPFDVNVTTQDPGQAAITRTGSSDEYYGTRVVITEDNFDNCGCGGFAYLTAFNDTSDYYKPAFVFNTSLTGAGEAITHETGHNLGLNHDGAGGVSYYQGHGSGDTGWAPIMGVGYYQQLVQWSKGEYTGANNTEDDIARIQTYGAPLMADDHGDNISGATALDTSTDGTTISLGGSGMIRRSEDADVFSFLSGAGNYTLNVDPAPFSPNLDIHAQLYNSAGTVVANSNPVNSLPAALTGSLAGGEYFLRIEGTGKGDPQDTGYTDYGSLGRYTVSGTVPDPGGLAAPVAMAAAPFYSPAIAPLYVSFDASGSMDADGSIVSRHWDFGDGSSASGVLVDHTFEAPGTYTVTLTVTDDDNLSDSDSLSVVVLNQAPVAVATVDVSSGMAPLTVNFSSFGSNDPDSTGSITAYSWDFGDGGSSSQANPGHTYTSWGQIVATLTVTDNLGATASATLALDIAAPPFVDQYATAEQFGAGTVNGTYLDLHDSDGSEQSIRERESGGKKNRRYSFLEHTWIFNVQSGNAVTLFLTGRQSASSDNDQMNFSYSINGSTYETLSLNLGTSSAAHVLPLPDDVKSGGDLRIRVNDSDQLPGNRELDTVYVDKMVIRTENQTAAVAPSTATNLSATAVSSGQIDLAWNDTSDNEYGFRIERSTDGVPWSTVSTVAANQISYNDTGLSPSTTYWYRVVAYNGIDANPSNVDSATTHDAGAVVLSASGYKRKGVKHVTLTWSGLPGANVYRDDGLVATGASSPHDDNIGSKGGGSYTYQVCNGDLNSTCSNEVTVVF
ncbi:MAG: PKD domain-containing protein [Gammaproteobacteria bacterium]